MRIPDPKANTTTEAYLAYKAGYLEENELKPVLYEPYLHFDGWLAYWAGLTTTYPVTISKKNLFDISKVKTNLTTLVDNGDGTLTVNTPAGSSSVGSAPPNKLSDFCPDLKVGDTAVLSMQTTGRERYIYLYGTGANVLWAVGTSKTITQALLDAQVLWYASGVNTSATISNIQLELGTTSSEYEPYSTPEMLTDEEALVAYLSGVTNTYPEEIKDPYDVRIVGYLKYLVSARWGRPDYPVNNEEFYLSTMKPPVVANDTPSADIELDDTAEAPFIDVKAYGDTSQTTYTGKNLADAFGGTWVKSNARNELIDGVYKMTANSGVIARVVLQLGGLAEGETYTLSFYSRGDTVASDAGWTYARVREGQGGGEWVSDRSVIAASDDYVKRTITFTANSVSDPWVWFYVAADNRNTNNIEIYIKDIQLEAGSTATSYEPYTGGVPAPNPDYPQAVNTVTGEQTVKVNGKNLSPSLDEYTWQAYHASNLSVTSTSVSCKTSTRSTSSGVYIARANLSTVCPALAQTGSVVSCSVNLSVASHIKCGFEGGVTGTYVSIDVPAGNTNISFITKTTGNLSFYVENKTGATMTISNLQVESGSTATEFSPYAQLHTVNLGSIELCKIDDYQDYIYRDGDDWYVHKATGKSMLGGLAWLPTAGRGSTAYRMVSTDLKGLFVPPLDNQRYLIGYCSHFKMETAEGTYYYRTGISGSPNGNRIYIWHPDYNKDTTESSTGFKTWLTNNNVVFYYPLVTPTDTKITDSSLVEQLDALMEGGSYEGKTYIKVTATDPNLPGLLYVEAGKYD